MRNLLALIIVAVAFGVVPSMAQNEETIDPRLLWMDPETDDFATIQQQVEAYYSNHDKGRGSGYKHWKRWERDMQSRLDEAGRVQNWASRSFNEYHRYEHSITNADDRVTTGYWNQVGPTDYVRTGNGYNGGIGRINCVGFHPTNPNILWVGTPAGGLWKTENLGATWTPLTDGLPSLGISGIVVHPTNTDIIYILTGDGDGGHTRSVGVLKTVNGGDTWMSTGLSWTISDNVRGYKMIMDPSNPSVLLVAATNGVHRTSDGGANWFLTSTGFTFDIEFKPGNSSIVYMHTSNTFRRSTNNGVTWSTINSGLPTGETRGAIGVSASNSNYVYVFTGPPTAVGAFKGLYVSYDSGLTFAARANTPNVLGYASNGQDDSHQTTYDFAFTVDPSAHGTLFSGGINVWKSINYGVTMTNVSQWSEIGASTYTHADIHNIDFSPVDGSLYVCSDGGIYRSTNGGATFSKLSSGMCTMAFYDIADYEGNANHILGGTQDNGTNYKNFATATWNHIDGGDGSDVMIDHTYPNTLYLNVNSTLVKSINSGASTVVITPSYGSWAELEMDANTSSRIYAGYNHGIYRSNNGGLSWTFISPADSSVSGGGQIRLGINNTNRMYTTNGSTLWRSDNVQSTPATWLNKTSGISGFIKDITVNPGNADEVAVCMGGYSDGQKVYISDSGGDSWTNISGSLPNIPINCIEWAPGTANGLYIGADIGVYYQDDYTGGWLPFRNGIPHVPIMDLEIHETTGKLRAGTFGRGLWETSVHTTCPSNYILTDGNLSGSGSQGYRYFQSSGYIRSTRTIDGGIGTDITYQAADHVQLNNGFEVVPGSEFHAFNAPCSSIPSEFLVGNPVTGTYEGPMPGLVQQVLDVEDMENADEFVVYPNPSSGRVNVEFSMNEVSNVSLKIIDVSGRVLVSLIDQEQIAAGKFKLSEDLSILSIGLYQCVLTTETETRTIQLAIAH